METVDLPKEAKIYMNPKGNKCAYFDYAYWDKQKDTDATIDFRLTRLRQIVVLSPMHTTHPIFYYFIIIFSVVNLNQLIYSTSQPLIIISMLKAIKKKLPQLPEQQAIAAVLTAADRKIELLARELEQQWQVKNTL
jgi:restriction endonuclease S subunit